MIILATQSAFLKIYESFDIKNLILPDTLIDETFGDIEFFERHLYINTLPKNPIVLKFLDNFQIKFLSSLGSHPRESNDSSLVFKLSVSKLNVLYTVDTE